MVFGFVQCDPNILTPLNCYAIVTAIFINGRLL